MTSNSVQTDFKARFEKAKQEMEAKAKLERIITEENSDEICALLERELEKRRAA